MLYNLNAFFFFQITHGLPDQDSVMQEHIPDGVQNQQRSWIVEFKDITRL